MTTAKSADLASTESQPLAGIRVLDFTRVVSGPFGTLLLALMGAEVVKIEHPEGGDEARGFCGNEELASRGLGSTFLSLNAGKRSVALDLKEPENQQIVRRLVRDCDVVVENFRPGVMERLGLSYDHLKAERPDLIYCAISGYGQTGPEAQSAGYDGAIQAASGLMSITGFPDGPPTRVGIPVGDLFSGVSAAFAIVSALYQRNATGRGQFIDVAMLDSILFAMRNAVAWWNIGEREPRRLGNMAWTEIPASDVFLVRDRHLMITVNTEPQFRRLCAALGIEGLLEEERFKDWPARKANRAALRAAIEDALSQDDARSWERRLKKAGLAASVIGTVPEVLRHPQVAHRDLFLRLDGTKGLDGPIEVMNAPFKFLTGRLGTDRPPPALGEHTEEVLARYR
ncbi:CoA transferase [Rhodospirillaceae bacterium SYSU D60014]|uniref:CaiB/BaiF CoA transferase family protein n=1 Tax=Virgifigura deserti TaxID=2268457 RepID=UPI000E6623FE